MFNNIGKIILKSKFGNIIFKKFLYLSIEMGLLHPDLDEDFKEIRKKCAQNSMTTIENMYYVYKATQYVIKNNIPGDFVECGVWKGGNLMLIAMTLMKLNNTERKIYLYDTYEGMSEPTDKDVDFKNENADSTWKKNQKDDHNDWCYSSLDEVKQNLFSTGYPKDKLIFVKGKVEDTIPATVPETISLLRLDTDWFESTYHNLIHLYPLLSTKGFLIIDDYGHWQGAREAVDRYFEENQVKMFLSRLDYSARAGIKIQ